MSVHDVVAGRRAAVLNPGTRSRLRVEQVDVLAERAPFLASAHACLAASVIVALWSAVPLRAGLVLFGAAIFLLGGVSLGVGAAFRRAPPQVVPRGTVFGLFALAGSAAATWTCAVFALVGRSGLAQEPAVLCAVHGVLASSILLAPLPAVGFTMAILPAIGLGAAIGWSAPDASPFHTVMLAVPLFVVLRAIRINGRAFARRALNGFAEAEQRDIISLLLRDFEESASNFLWSVDVDLRFRRVSRRLAGASGAQHAELLEGASLPDWLLGAVQGGAAARADAARFIALLGEHLSFRDVTVRLGSAPEQRVLSLTGTPVIGLDGSFNGYRGVGADVTGAKRAEDHIVRLARFDALTGLANRASFRDAIGESCCERDRFALLLLDLDGFKPVNDTLGHQAGDALLVETAARIADILDGNDAAFRLGGDEFAVIHRTEAGVLPSALAEQLVRSLAQPVALGGNTASVRTSIGLVLSEEGGDDPEALFRAADLALYEAKARGGGVAVAFEKEFLIEAERNRRLESELRQAIGAGALELDFQPIVDLGTGEVTTAEALVRWPHPSRGRLLPADFIPFAERSGLVVPLGNWVLREACREATSWEGTALVAVNVSAVQFRDPGLIAAVDAALAESGLPADRLELEITESVFLDAAASTLDCLNALRTRGVRIALDDFGTGYSALNYLRCFPFDKIKIDSAFVQDLGTSRNATAIVLAIVALANSLGINTTGEGVETTSQVELLQSTGCSHVQGYLFGEPCDPDTMARIMRAGSTPPPPDRAPGAFRLEQEEVPAMA